MHFVTGGFSGATQVAVDLCLAARGSDAMEAMLVLRRKRNTDAARVEALRAQGLRVGVVPGWSHAATIVALRNLAVQHRPDVLVAHGFSEHLWGRYAGLWAGVPQLVQVEHNSRERYTRWRLAQSRWLARRSAALVGVSDGVRDRLIELGFPAERCLAIPNGVDLERFPAAELLPMAERLPALVMASRFARQKDQATLIDAVALLAQKGLRPPLYFAGLGKKALLQQAQARVRAHGLESQVHFWGQVSDLPQRLMRSPLFVLSTHYEGMPLALVEAMAAGCACVASDVVGVRGVIEPGQTGELVPEADAAALAAVLERLLTHPAEAARLGLAARQAAEARFDRHLMHARYAQLLLGLPRRPDAGH
ncbi:glycosyl transferase [Acidovorax sp. SRB_14]|uniref:glycosyltransferase n=1 Tax=unclassified Acidovorax TaxID=2684926 RepID=UPI001562F2EB|nr:MULTISPECIES: glycosyltransferase [unclassified Acidovorax]NMM78776.1 glycosyl transferase [Acidovorax sp. SRB_24]NMM81088.1 glycosyl transferase [Acidovorax sp. SRB_14]NMM91740.1 glycosyl transferase [Rhodococcus sp. SRB_17]